MEDKLVLNELDDRDTKHVFSVRIEALQGLSQQDIKNIPRMAGVAKCAIR